MESFRMRVTLPAGTHNAAYCNAEVGGVLKQMGAGHEVEWTTQVVHGGSSVDGSGADCLVLLVEGLASFGGAPDKGLQTWATELSRRLRGNGVRAFIGGGDPFELPPEK